MKITYLLLLIGSIITSSDNYFFDIIYNQEYVVDVSKFSYNFIPAIAQCFFTAKVEESKKMQIQIKVIKNANLILKFDVCGFYGHPSDMQILVSHDLCRFDLEGKKVSSDEHYDIYLYDFKTIYGVNYLTFHFLNMYKLDYLSVLLS